MNILVACEESQAVTIALRSLGHSAFSCDITECSGGHPEWHIQSDVIPLINGRCSFITSDGVPHSIYNRWDMLFAFPPCTYLCNTGTPHLNISKYGDKAIARYKKREEAFDFFMSFVHADCDKIVIENPVGLPNSRYRKPDQIIQPWMFGDNYSKKTCLWLKGVKPLIPTFSLKPDNCKSYAYDTMIDQNGKSISWSSDLSKKLRSKTFPGIALAMAFQFCGSCLSD